MMLTGQGPWLSACIVSEVAPGDGVRPAPPLQESGSVLPWATVQRSAVTVVAVVGCARRRASLAVPNPNTPRCGVRCCIRPAPPEHSASVRRGVAVMTPARDGADIESSRWWRRAHASRPAPPRSVPARPRSQWPTRRWV